MSKYGFNENEVRKTIITKIDKDGFHKEETFDGNVDGGTSDITFATITVTGESRLGMVIPEFLEAVDEDPAYLGVEYHDLFPGDTKTIPLYKGITVIPFPETDDSTRVAVEGDAETIGDNNVIMITGDFSIGCMPGE